MALGECLTAHIQTDQNPPTFVQKCYQVVASKTTSYNLFCIMSAMKSNELGFDGKRPGLNALYS